MEPHRCFICLEPFRAGEMVLPDINEGLGHRACFGEDREGYCNLDTGEPLGPDEPIPAGEPYDPADYADAPTRPATPAEIANGLLIQGATDEQIAAAVTAGKDMIDPLPLAARALLDAITFDDSGANGRGGNGGLISRETIRKADELRLVLNATEQQGKAP